MSGMMAPVTACRSVEKISPSFAPAFIPIPYGVFAGHFSSTTSVLKVWTDPTQTIVERSDLYASLHGFLGIPRYVVCSDEEMCMSVQVQMALDAARLHEPSTRGRMRAWVVECLDGVPALISLTYTSAGTVAAETVWIDRGGRASLELVAAHMNSKAGAGEALASSMLSIYRGDEQDSVFSGHSPLSATSSGAFVH